MKRNQFLGLSFLLAMVLFFNSCKVYEDDVLNGAVQIEMVESPTNRSLVNLGDAETIRIKFTSDTKIAEVHASLYTKDANVFDINGDDVRLKQDEYLNSPLFFNEEATETSIFDVHNTDIGETEYTFEQEVDLSNYAVGTCFVLFGTARIDNDSAGHDSQGIYFCKKNGSE